MSRTAAFYDLDGTLLRTNVVHAYAYYALRLPSLTDRFTRSLQLAASLPLYFAAEQVNRKLFNDVFYLNYKGFSEDRLVVLGEEMFDKLLKRSIFAGSLDLVRRSREQGHEQVLVTGALDFITVPVARYLEVDHFVANKLEMIDGYATGRVERPLLAGASKARWIQDYARARDIDLAESYAYADSYSDYPMLSVVGNPVPTNPDLKLRTAAQAFDWPVIHLA